jgi:hypothetical protein
MTPLVMIPKTISYLPTVYHLWNFSLSGLTGATVRVLGLNPAVVTWFAFVSDSGDLLARPLADLMTRLDTGRRTENLSARRARNTASGHRVRFAGNMARAIFLRRPHLYCAKLRLT